MKINFIAILSIIFYTTILVGSDKVKIIEKVIYLTKDQRAPSAEHILDIFDDKRLEIDLSLIHI